MAKESKEFYTLKNLFSWLVNFKSINHLLKWLKYTLMPENGIYKWYIYSSLG